MNNLPTWPNSMRLSKRMRGALASHFSAKRHRFSKGAMLCIGCSSLPSWPPCIEVKIGAIGASFLGERLKLWLTEPLFTTRFSQSDFLLPFPQIKIGAASVYKLRVTKSGSNSSKFSFMLRKPAPLARYLPIPERFNMHNASLPIRLSTSSGRQLVLRRNSYAVCRTRMESRTMPLLIA